MACAVSPEAGIRLPTGHFAIEVEPSLPKPVRNNKTVGLVTWEEAGADGN
jgi:hypothetical protein